MTNTRIESPCLDNLNDRERLESRLDWEGYTETKMKSDGNCQFRALADQLYKTSDCHKRVRQEIVNQMKSHPKLYKHFVDDMDLYIKNMSKTGVWGDNLTLQAAADVYGVKVIVITSFKETPRIEILPGSRKQADRVVHLSFLAEVHYNSIYLKDSGSSSGSCTASMDVQTKTNKKKKKKKTKKKEKEKESKQESENEDEEKIGPQYQEDTRPQHDKDKGPVSDKHSLVLCVKADEPGSRASPESAFCSATTAPSRNRFSVIGDF